MWKNTAIPCLHISLPLNDIRLFLPQKRLSSLYTIMPAPFLVPRLFFFVYIKSPSPKRTRMPHTTDPTSQQLKTPTFKPT